jgi:hypothetical protein
MVKLKKISDVDMSLEVLKILRESKDPAGITDEELSKIVEQRLNARGLTSEQQDDGNGNGTTIQQ